EWVLAKLARNPNLNALFADYPRLTFEDVKACLDYARALVEKKDQAARRSTSAVLAIDAPLGWPVALARTLFTHRAGERLSSPANDMFRCTTDSFIQRELSKTPLDVGADRIARTAHAALRFLEDLA